MSLLLVSISGILTQDTTLCGHPILSCFNLFLLINPFYYFHAHMCIYSQPLILIPSLPRVDYFSILLTYLIFYLVFHLDLDLDLGLDFRIRLLFDFLVYN
jgi:hypothetical protein